jgi:predicted PurR-regulated permease PerM
VQFLTKHHIPEGAAIALVYTTMALSIVGLAIAIVPPIMHQLSAYLQEDYRLSSSVLRAQHRIENVLGDITGDDVNLMEFEDIDRNVERIMARLRTITPGMLDDAGSTLGEAVLIFVMGAYWLTSHEKAIAFITQLSPIHHREKTAAIISEIEHTMGAYVRGVVIVASIVGVLNFIVFAVFGVPGALALAVVIAVTTTIPMIGGFLGGILATFMTLLSAPDYVPLVLITFLTIQQIENYILSPRIISTHVQLDSLLVIVYTAIGFVMFGIVGALIAVPIMGTVHILLTHIVIEPHKRKIQTFQTQNGIPIVQSNEQNESHGLTFETQYSNSEHG